MDTNEIVEGNVDWKGRQALRHKHGGKRTSVLLLVAYGFESSASIALEANLVTYFTGVMHFEVADAANQLTNFMGIMYLLAILISFLADACIGRLKALIISGCIELLGLMLLTIQAYFPKLKPPPCNPYDPSSHCQTVSGHNAALLFISLYLVAAGSGGIKTSLPSHGADQFDIKDKKEAKNMSSFFNFLVLATGIGGVISVTFVVWIQDNRGWTWGFGVGVISMFLAVTLFFSGLPINRMQPVQGSSAVTQIIQVYVAAFRNRNLQLPDDPSELYEICNDNEAGNEIEFSPHTDSFRFLDKAAIQSKSTGQVAESPWKLCRVTQVEHAKTILGTVPIFCCTIIMTLCLAQFQTFSIQESLTMDTRITNSFRIPPASLPIIPLSFLIIVVPIYDQIIVPFLRKITNHPTGITHLQRIGVGLMLSVVSMAIASLMEVQRKKVAREHNMLDAIPTVQPLPISVFWLSFQYFIFGIADTFTNVGLLEFFYSEAPKALKAVSISFIWCSMALGYFLSTILVKTVNQVTKGTKSGGWLAGNNINRNHLDLFFLLIATLSLINFVLYLFVSKKYKYRSRMQPSVRHVDAGL